MLVIALVRKAFPSKLFNNKDQIMKFEECTDSSNSEAASDFDAAEMAEKVEDEGIPYSFEPSAEYLDQMDGLEEFNIALNDNIEAEATILSNNADGNDDDFEEVEDLNEPEGVELDENQFNEMDEELGSIEEISVVDNYLQSIQNRISGNGMADEYKNGTL